MFKTSQNRKIAIVTGANSGLGFETTKAFANKEIEVILACRHLEKGEEAKNSVLKCCPEAHLQVMPLDLTNFDSVRDFAAEVKRSYPKLDILVNNAGVMMTPFQQTESGLELQFTTNYLGHFLLTGLLLAPLEKASRAHIVSLSSIAHRWGHINFDDLQHNENYDRNKAYGQSKLACLMFAYELQRRLEAAGKNSRSFAAHPGLSKTNLDRHLTGFSRFMLPFIYPFAQTPKQGAFPEIRAALDDSLKGGEYIGPSGMFQFKGKPVIVDSCGRSKDLEISKKLWEVSAQLTGISYL